MPSAGLRPAYVTSPSAIHTKCHLKVSSKRFGSGQSHTTRTGSPIRRVSRINKPLSLSGSAASSTLPLNRQTLRSMGAAAVHDPEAEAGVSRLHSPNKRRTLKSTLLISGGQNGNRVSYGNEQRHWTSDSGIAWASRSQGHCNDAKLAGSDRTAKNRFYGGSSDHCYRS